MEIAARTAEIATGAGAARAELDEVTDPALVLVLTHGAGGGLGSPDLLAARRAGLDTGAAVARVLQPYRVRGARAPGSEARQDAAWLEIIAAVRERLGPAPLVQGGRSNGARVACRTAGAAGARAVLALAFPLHPPGHPERSRAGELRVAGTDVLVINGDRDPFGVPGLGRTPGSGGVMDSGGAPGPGGTPQAAAALGPEGIAGSSRVGEPAGVVRVVVLRGETHSLSRHPGEIYRTVCDWLAGLLAQAAG